MSRWIRGVTSDGAGESTPGVGRVLVVDGGESSGETPSTPSFSYPTTEGEMSSRDFPFASSNEEEWEVSDIGTACTSRRENLKGKIGTSSTICTS